MKVEGAENGREKNSTGGQWSHKVNMDAGET